MEQGVSLGIDEEAHLGSADSADSAGSALPALGQKWSEMVRVPHLGILCHELLPMAWIDPVPQCGKKVIERLKLLDF